MKKHRILSVLLALVLILTLLPTAALAAAAENKDFSINSSGVLTYYRGDDSKVVIPEGVTSIGEGAFRGRKMITSVTIPEGVTSIGEEAFQGCISLVSVNFPKSLTSIDGSAFKNCESLSSVTLPEGLTTIGSYAFCRCESLSSVTLPEGLTTIDTYAFSGCDALTSITIPGSVTSIGDYAFSWCNSLANITIQEGVTTIGKYAFESSDALTTVSIPASVTSIKANAFSWCKSLTTVNYGGTSQQWNAITIEMDNEALLLATLNCNGGDTGIGLGNFKKVNTYAPGTFTDVPEDQWYTSNVKSAYERNLVAGTSTTTFSPNSNISVVATITLAARIHSIYMTGKAEFQQSTPWYQSYVDYAMENGIISAGQFSDYNANITRRNFVGIMCHAMPAEEFRQINAVERDSIPDVPEDTPYSDEIYTFYKAGISVGNDKVGTFAPETPILRSAAATLVTRMVDPSLRISDVELERLIRPVSMSLTSTDIVVEAYRSYRVEATLRPEESTAPITWTSSNPSVATVSFNDEICAVYGVSEGTAVITATSGTLSASCTVTVTKAEPVTATNYAFVALKYLYDHLKVPSSLGVYSIRCGIYNRAGMDGSILPVNDHYYAVTITYQAANSLGAMVTDTYVTLFNQSKNKVYYDFVGYAESGGSDAWGSRKIDWLMLNREALALANGGGLTALSQEQVQQVVSWLVR